MLVPSPASTAAVNIFCSRLGQEVNFVKTRLRDLFRFRVFPAGFLVSYSYYLYCRLYEKVVSV